MMLYMLDAVILSDLVHRRSGFERVLRRLEGMSIRQTLLSAITIAELETMIRKARDPGGKSAQVRKAILRFTAVDFGELAARHYGEIRSHLERRGQRIGPMDLLIAAHARSLAAVLVTDNLREFSRVPGLAAENWLR